MGVAPGSRAGLTDFIMRLSPHWSAWLAALFSCLVAVPVRGITPDRFQEAGEGLAWRRDSVASGPLSLHVVRVDRSRGDLRLMPTLAMGEQQGLNTLSGQLRLIPREVGQPVAAINGDFYTTENESFSGDPRGLFVSRSVLVSAPVARDCFWIDSRGLPHVGLVQSQFALIWPDGTATSLGLNEEAGESAAVLYTPAVGVQNRPRGVLGLSRVDGTPWVGLKIGETNRVRLRTGGRASGGGNEAALFLNSDLQSRARQLPPDSVFQIRTLTQPDLRGVLAGIGGGPALVHHGQAQAARAAKSNERHPRSALGWNARYYFLVTVDGRQPDWSIGVTLPMLAESMVSLGCEEAINLDGGGSTELWLNGRILNRPCYGRERPMATGLAVVRQEMTATTNAAAKPLPIRTAPSPGI